MPACMKNRATSNQDLGKTSSFLLGTFLPGLDRIKPDQGMMMLEQTVRSGLSCSRVLVQHEQRFEPEQRRHQDRPPSTVERRRSRLSSQRTNLGKAQL